MGIPGEVESCPDRMLGLKVVRNSPCKGGLKEIEKNNIMDECLHEMER